MGAEDEDDDDDAAGVALFWLFDLAAAAAEDDDDDDDDAEVLGGCGFSESKASKEELPSVLIDLSRPWRELSSWAKSGFWRRLSISVKLGSICLIKSWKPLRNSGLLSSAMMSASRLAASGAGGAGFEEEAAGAAGALALGGAGVAEALKSSRAPEGVVERVAEERKKEKRKIKGKMNGVQEKGERPQCKRKERKAKKAGRGDGGIRGDFQ